MIVDHKQGVSGVLVDRGTGKRIPFARKFDTETGHYEAIAVAPNGKDYLCDEDGKAVVVKGRAVGKLELLPLDGAVQLGVIEPPKKAHSVIQPMPAEQKLDGLDQYKRLYFDVWQFRGEAKRCVADRWDDFLSKNEFLDAFVLKRRQ